MSEQAYVYIRSEPGLWTVGFYDPDGDWQPESDHDSTEAAAERVAYLNGDEDRDYDALAARLAEAEQDIEQWKKVYDLRGRALQRPCINCGYVPQVIRPADSADVAPCKKCYGTGAIDAPTSADDPSCPECDGEGRI